MPVELTTSPRNFAEAVRRGLSGARPGEPRQVASRGASAPGRVPRRTNRIGAGAALAIVGAHRAEPLVAPALGEADHEQAGALGRPRAGRRRRVDEHRLGCDARQLLHDERGVARAAGSRRASPFAARRRRAASAARRGHGAIQAPSSSAAQSCSAPPNGTTTGCCGVDRRHRPCRSTSTADVARRVGRGRCADRAARDALAEQRPAAVERAGGRSSSSRARGGRGPRPGPDVVNATARAATPRSREQLAPLLAARSVARRSSRSSRGEPGRERVRDRRAAR